jgi:hypothetical protein
MPQSLECYPGTGVCILYVRWSQQIKEASMRTRVGLWIDHRKALVVAVTDKGEDLGLIISKAEKQLRRSGDSPLQGSYVAQHERADDSRQRSRTGHLNLYYDAVIACIADAESILLFGPGEAKGELRKRLEARNLGKRIAAVETVDKMTNRQIAAKVRQYFTDKRSAIGATRNYLTRSSSGRERPCRPKSR